MRVPNSQHGLYTVILAGGIGSGKSTAGQVLEELGCARIDLDQLSRDVLAPRSPLIDKICAAFGSDLVDAQTGELNRRALAERAFATPEGAAQLEALELPAIRVLLSDRLEHLAATVGHPACCVVEVPLLDRMEDSLTSFDEVLVVWCPLEMRRIRAIARGMTGDDFDARAAKQPSDAWLAARATTLIDNTGDAAALRARLEEWYRQHESEGWL